MKPDRNDGGFMLGPTIGIAAVLLLAFFIFLALSLWTVGPGEEGVKYNNEEGVEEEAYGEGWHWVNPITDDVAEYDTRDQIYTADGLSAATVDTQAIGATVVVRYNLDDGWAWWIHQKKGPNYADKIIEPAVKEGIKAATAQFNVTAAIENRPLLKEEIRSVLDERLAENHITLQSADVVNIAIPDKILQATERKVIASQEAEEQRRLVEKEEELKRQKIIQAEANRNATIIEAEGDAKAIQLVRQNLTGDYITYVMVDRNWDGKLPETYVQGQDQGAGFGLFLNAQSKSGS